MPKSKFQDIYLNIKTNIIENNYSNNMLPSEFQLIDTYDCSRNTVRRAIAQLNKEGYVQSIKGKGVIILEQLAENIDVHLDINEFSGLRSISIGHGHTTTTKILNFKKLIIDLSLEKKTNLKVGSEVYYIERLRIINGHPWVIDTNYFLCEVVKDLTIETAQTSIYSYIEHQLGQKILASRRIITIKKATTQDLEVLEMDDLNCVGVIMNNAYIESGQIFEYTESHYSPEHFVFEEFAQR